MLTHADPNNMSAGAYLRLMRTPMYDPAGGGLLTYYLKGGMGSGMKILEQACEENGVFIKRGCDVTKIIIEDDGIGFDKIQIKSMDLFPYMVMLVIITAINRQPLIDLTIDDVNIKHHLDENIKGVSSHKNRGHSDDIKFYDQISKYSPSSIIDMVLKITNTYREKASVYSKEYLWLTLINNQVRRIPEDQLSRISRDFSKFSNLKNDQGNNMIIEFRRLRNTSALLNLIKYKNFWKIKRVLKHKNISNTRKYTSNWQGLPEFLKPLKLSQDAYFIFLTLDEINENKTKLAKSLNISIEEVDKIITEYDGIFCHCKNPWMPPPEIKGQKAGKMCTKFWGCLGCANIVLFPDDLWKLFSFVNYINDSMKV